MAANTCFFSTCQCCPCNGTFTNTCCPGQCSQTLHLTVTDTSAGHACTQVVPLNWNGAEPFDCGDVATTGCWVNRSVTFGTCTYIVRVSCVKSGGVCTFFTEFVALNGPNFPNHFCFAQTIKQCNPLNVVFNYSATIPISTVCGCTDQAQRSTGTLTV